MYKEFYGLSGMPFSLLPDADFLFPSRRHRRAINLMDYGIETQAGFMVITGEVGAGKTTVVRRYIKNAQQDVVVGVVTNPSQTLGRLLNWVAMAFDFKDTDQDDAKLYHAFVAFLLEQYGSGKRTVLIIDEAQNLSAAMLEDLRMLSNVNNEKDQLLQIILVGQPELLETLKRPDLRQFVQRIAVHCHLDPLNPPETAAYIHHRLEMVGGSPDLFSDEACAAVHFFTGGVPRLINLLCDQSMVYGFSEDQPHISSEIIAEVALDRAGSGLSPFHAVPEGWDAWRLPQDTAAILKAIQEEKKA